MLEEGLVLMEKADKKLENSTKNKLVGIFGNRFEDALELYKQAITKLKIIKNYKAVAECYMKTVQCHMKLDQKYFAADAYYNAGVNFRLAGLHEETANAFQLAANTFISCGKMANAGKALQEIAEDSEKSKDYEGAAGLYQKAGECLEAEQRNAAATECFLKSADNLMLSGRYEEAIKKYEQLSWRTVDDKLLNSVSKEALYKATICLMASMQPSEDMEKQVEQVQKKFDEYKDKDTKFTMTRECKIVDELLFAFEDKNLKAYQITLKNHDAIMKFSTWETDMFLKIKELLEVYCKQELA